ncbi:MAG: HupE/UreJ family protein, partial [Myxococcales bacterium]|nr:HupE/UreJ family protein [Myxococcales bacterium]
MPAPRIARLMAALGTSALLLCAGSSLVRAHLGSTKYLRIEHTAEGLLVHAEIEAIDAAMQLGLGEEASFEAILAEQERLRLWLVEGIQVRVEDRPCAARAGAPELLERDRRPFIGVALRYRCARAEGEQIWLRDDTIFPEDRQHEAIVRTAFAGEASASVLRAGSRELIVSRSPGLEGLMGAFLWEGVLHFVTGYDHILFLLSLILSAGFIVRARGLRKALRDVTILVTAFTLGHSVTLITAALGYVVLPS